MTWIFGYGSLVWRPAFPFAECRHAYIVGWARRFWQGSTDHRGVVGAPGRVVTLVRACGARTWGTAYRVKPNDEASVLASLDHREKGGYDRHSVALFFKDDGHATGLVYRATPSNPNYLGPASPAQIAAQVRRARGPSGHNSEYVLRLDAALRCLGVVDAHVRSIAELVRDSAD